MENTRTVSDRLLADALKELIESARPNKDTIFVSRMTLNIYLMQKMDEANSNEIADLLIDVNHGRVKSIRYKKIKINIL